MKYEVEKIRYGDKGRVYTVIESNLGTREEAEILVKKTKLTSGITFYEELSIRTLDEYDDCVDVDFPKATEYKKRKPKRDHGLLGHIFYIPEAI